jgi:2-polyprenyl-3-methyl-5-hydroxy-6-metoxy-1,4-benzoquinol methylase
MNAKTAGMECPVCGEGSLALFERKRDIHGTIGDVLICGRCLVLTNASAFAHDLSLQAQASETFYRLTEDDLDGLEEQVGAQQRLLAYILPFLGRPEEKTMLEIGCGRGLMLVAARRMGFRRAIGVDPNTETFREVVNRIAIDGGIVAYRDLREVSEKVDCAVMWHTLEHIPAPRSFLADLAERLNPGAILFLQVPQYYQPYICATHYYFYNEPSIRRLMATTGFAVLEIGYDVENQFTTVVGRHDGK